MIADSKESRRLRDAAKSFLQAIVRTTLKLDFEESRHRFIGLLEEVIHRIATAQPGYVFANLASHGFELLILAKRLGLTHDDGPLVFQPNRHDQLGILGVTFTMQRGGVTLYVSVATPLSEKMLKAINVRLESWRLAARSLTPKHFLAKLKDFNEDVEDGCVVVVHELGMPFVIEQPQDRRRKTSQINPSIGYSYEDLIEATGLKRGTLQGLARKAKLPTRLDSQLRIFTLEDIKAMAAIHFPTNPAMRGIWNAFIQKNPKFI